MVILYVLIAIFLIIWARIKIRGFFWKARDGEELTFIQFMGRWKEGIFNITPLQQTKTSLWSFLPIFAGILWGIAITFIGKTYWLSLILLGSLPLTSIQFISTIQKYRAQKRADDAFKEALRNEKKQKKRRGKRKEFKW